MRDITWCFGEQEECRGAQGGFAGMLSPSRAWFQLGLCWEPEEDAMGSAVVQ